MHSVTRRGLALLLLMVWAATARVPEAIAQETSGSRDLGDLSIEELMNESVTSVSKRGQKLSQAAAALFVINQEDIRRSGALNIPDLLRIVPGLDVAQINSNTWAISARGFNHQFSDKLLVLIDGRAVYTPTNGGVNWDTQDVPLQDIERIEVIRGPGATVWGANAVNGVINVITKQTKDTQGVLVAAGGGTQDQAFGTAQYGGKIGEDASYRVFTKYFDHNDLPNLAGQDTNNDGWHLLHGGFRVDGSLSTNDFLTAQGDIYRGSEGAAIDHIASISPPVNETVLRVAGLSGGNILGRWKHILANGSDTTVQVYFDRYIRSGPSRSEVRNTVDFDFQQHRRLGLRQDVVWGAEYRRSADRIAGTIDDAFEPADRTIQLFSAFVQDEITLAPERVFLTVGTKLEHNAFTGFELGPSVRMTWTPSARHTLWAAVADAERTPARDDSNGDFNITVFALPNGAPAELSIVGNPRQKSERLLATDLGYRVQASSRISVDLAMFYNRYRQLRTLEPGAPILETDPVRHFDIPLVYSNQMHGTTEGLELSAHFKVTDRWTLSPGYALLHMNLHTDPGSQDTRSVADIEGSSPRHQAQLRSSMSLPRGFVWDTSVYFVDRLPAEQVPSYTRLDTQLTWRSTPRLEWSLVGQNLLQNLHVESNDIATSVQPSQVKRSVYAKFTWTF
jgi:iron complex outermembrane recepter protein